MVSQLCLPVISKCTVLPDRKSTLPDLKLSVSDLPMLSCHYIQKGVLLTPPPFSMSHLITLLKRSLSQTLAHFPPLAGRLITDDDGHVYVSCNDAGVDFVHADGTGFRVGDVTEDGGDSVAAFFGFDRAVGYEGHFRPVLGVQVTELADGVFVGLAVNHAVTDGTSFWNFFNAFAEVSRRGLVSRAPDFSRESVLISQAVLKVPAGGPVVTFDVDAPVRERIFRFSRESILKLKAKVNHYSINNNSAKTEENGGIDIVELMGKHSNDTWKANPTAEISSFQSLSALLWRAVTRARKLPPSKTTTFRMAVNCRHRLEPKLDPLYFGNAIQSVPTLAAAGDVLNEGGLRWCAEQLNKSVAAHGDAAVRARVADWEMDPRCFPLGNFDGAMITMGSSPRFPMYENDFGWGRPVSVRSGRANKFDGKISAFPGRAGNGSVDLEVVLAPETMAGLISDMEFMSYVSDC